MPAPSYPIHIYGPLFAGADLRQIPMRTDADFFEGLETAWDVGWPKPRVLVISFPHNPTGACVDLPFMQRVVDFCREHEMIVVHDFAYADVGFDGYRPPSILQADGAKECAVELYSMTKSFSMAGWRVAFLSGNAEVVAALVKLKTLPRLRHVPAHPDRRHRHHERGARLPEGGLLDLPEPARRAVRRAWPASGGTSPSRGGTMFVWAPIPEPYRELDSVEFSSMLVRECAVATSPGRRASGPAARASCASPSSRTSSASPRPSATSARGSRSSDLELGRRLHGAVTERSSSRDARPRYRRRVPTYLVRVWLPDRPGALGQVASRIGAVRGDVVGIEILERGAGRAVDELVVALPEDGLLDLLVGRDQPGRRRRRGGRAHPALRPPRPRA